MAQESVVANDNNLIEFRQRASQLSGGRSSETIRLLVAQLLTVSSGRGTLLDFGAGKGDLLRDLMGNPDFRELAGIDLFERSPDLPSSIGWYKQDLNDVVQMSREFDVVVCSETIEHLENPRQVFRNLNKLLRPGGVLILTMPNQESIRSLCGILVGGHFALFLGDACYPAHITALLRLDLVRICEETGFLNPRFVYTNEGGIPKLPRVTWQKVSAGILRGRLFSDNLGMIARKVS